MLSPIVMISTILPTTHCMDPDKPNHHDLVFLNFLVIHFFLIFWLQYVSYHIWNCAQTMQILLHHCQQESPLCPFFCPCFMAKFTSVAILGNADRPCQQCLNIIKKMSGYFWIDYHIWNYTQDPEIVLQDYYQQLAIPLNFSDILLLF